MTDTLYDLIQDVQHNGLRWVSIIAIYSLVRKERRNHLLNKRDEANFHNQRMMMKAMGVESQWKDGPRFGLKETDLPNLKKSLTTFYKATFQKKLSYPRRKNMITNFLKAMFTASLSKKLISALVSMGIVALNSKYGWNIPQDAIYGILGLSAAHISLQTIIDSIRANAIGKVTTTVAEIKSIDVSKLSYNDMIPFINDVNTTLTQCFQDMKSGKVTDATKEAMALYLKVHTLIEANQTPSDIPSVTGIGA